ncbi:MAG: VWA domain-containing protein [Oscillospiraceae bacterium]|nr:VWA domain-containing protein [Oscillospiraceae bacterium]
MKTTNKNIALTLMLLMTASALGGCGNAAKDAAMTADAPALNGEIAMDAAKDAKADDAGGAEAEAAPAAVYEGADYAEGAAEAGDAFSAKKSDAMLAIEPAAVDGAAAAAGAVPDGDPDDTSSVLDRGEPFVLTAGEWNDNENWGFFANLIHSGTIEFPAYGLNPVNRIAVTVTHDGTPVQNQTVTLNADDILWTAKTDKNGNAYLFYGDAFAGKELTVKTADAEPVSLTAPAAEDGQGGSGIRTLEYTVETGAESRKYEKTEVMFILDTTGSMGDEISYLQKDFASIAEEVSDGNMTFSVNFYRDKGDVYVTRCNPFTDDIAAIKKKLNAEYADGGGDAPEAVAEILEETMCRGDWHDDTNKIAFLIFDAPPHGDPNDNASAQPMIAAAIAAAAEQGVHLVPVVASNADRTTELFGRAAAIMTNSNYVFLTDDSGVGDSHLEPIIGDYDVELLHDIIVRNIREITA